MHAVLQVIEDRFSRELSGLEGDACQTHPGDRPYLWSIGQVIEHLVLSYRSTSEKLEAALRKGSLSRNRRRSPLQWILQLMVLSFGHFPRGVPAFDGTVPANGPLPLIDGDGLALRLEAEMKSMDDLLGRCRRRFGIERIAVHPLLGPLRVDQWRRYHAVHTLHHLRQLQRIRQEVAPHPSKLRLPGTPEPQLVEGTVSSSLTKELHIPAQRSIT